LGSAHIGSAPEFGGDGFRRGGFRGSVLSRDGGFLLVWLLGRGPFHFLGQVDAGGGDPFVETFVELDVVYVEGQVVVSLLDGEDFCFSRFAVLSW